MNWKHLIWNTWGLIIFRSSPTEDSSVMICGYSAMIYSRISAFPGQEVQNQGTQKCVVISDPITETWWPSKPYCVPKDLNMYVIMLRVCLKKNNTMSMSESNTWESSSKLNIFLEILPVLLAWTYLGVKQQRWRTWHTEYEALYPWETEERRRFLCYFLRCWIDMFS